MRFLADENVDPGTVNALRELGHDVVWIMSDAPGSADEDILTRASLENRVLLTYDKDFGDLVFHRRMAADSGVILLRTDGPSDQQTKICLEKIQERSDWSGVFAVFENDDTRIRRVPSADGEPD